MFGQLTVLSTCACFTDWSGDRHIIVGGNDCWRSSGTRCNDGGNVSGNNCFSNSGSLRSRRSMRSMSDVRFNCGWRNDTLSDICLPPRCHLHLQQVATLYAEYNRVCCVRLLN